MNAEQLREQAERWERSRRAKATGRREFGLTAAERARQDRFYTDEVWGKLLPATEDPMWLTIPAFHPTRLHREFVDAAVAMEMRHVGCEDAGEGFCRVTYLSPTPPMPSK